MRNVMLSKQPSVFVMSMEEGVARGLNSNYAFLLESTMNEYYHQRNRNLTQIRGLLDTKGYGIGMPPGSVSRDEFDLAVLRMQEDNRGKCPKEEDHRAKGLGMENIGGILVVLVCGLLVAIFMAVLEFVWMMRQTPVTEPPFVYTRTPVDYQRRLDLPSLKQTDNPVILELKGGSLSTFSRRVLSHLRNLQANLRYLK
ncbi:hypothetical protein NHX12_016896, partial [Muraenolepis orangiensis]